MRRGKILHFFLHPLASHFHTLENLNLENGGDESRGEVKKVPQRRGESR